MNYRTNMPSIFRRLSLALLSTGFAASFSWAQVAKTQDALAAAPDSATLAKYDKNHNGVLDPDELAAMQADQAKAANVPVEKVAADDKDVIEMSPFTVDSGTDKGYKALNTMSGSRLNTKLEDVAASITVVTKEQLMDFAATDINDIFAMEASTEGTRTYTANFNDGKGDVDAVALNPNSANRIRGLGAANQSLGNWNTSSAIPVDVYNVDAVEIARGANSSIFGMGEGSGTINLIPASANLTRSHTTVQTTATSYGTVRASLDLNRPLFKNVLAIRFSGLTEDKGYVRNPAYDQTRRMTLGLTLQPFKYTTIRVSYEAFNESYSRANSSTATDYMSLWAKAGKPSYDPTTSTWKLDGKPVQNTATNTWTYGTPDGVIDPVNETAVQPAQLASPQSFPAGVWLASMGSNRTRSMMWVDQGRSQEFTQSFWSVPSANSATTGLPNAWVDHEIVNFGLPSNFQVPARFVGGLSYNGVPASTDKNFYNYEDINLAALNHGNKKAEYDRAEVEQYFLRTPHQMLALQIGAFKERINDLSMAFVGNGGDGVALTVMPEVNTKYPDGTPNPYFGAPYIGTLSPQIYYRPQDNRNYRGNLVYELNLSREKNFFLRLLGIQRILGYKEYRDAVNAPQSIRYAYRITQGLTNAVAAARVSGTNLTSTNPSTFNPAFLAAPLLAGTGNGGSSNFSVRYFMGDGVGGNVDWATSSPNFSGQSIPFVRWGSTTSTMGQNKWITENLPVGAAYYTLGEQESQARTKGWVWQGFLLDDRIVPTYGERQDRQRTRANTANQSTNIGSDGYPIDYSYLSNFTNMPWNVVNTGTGATEAVGMTRTKGIVVKPFRWLNLQYNQSTSAKPAGYALDLQAQPLPNPNGYTKDYGFTLNLFSNKLVLRLNKFESFTKDARGANDVVANRTTLFDFDNSATGDESKFDLEDWLYGEYAKIDGFPDPTVGTAAQQAKWLQQAHDKEGIQQPFIDTMRANTRAMTSDQSSKGYELEINYNPTRFWTMKVTGNKQEAMQSAIAPSWQKYRDARMPLWTTIVSPYLAPADATHPAPYYEPYWNHFFSTGNVPSQYWAGTVAAPMALTLALQGKSVPQGRRYTANYLTSYRLAGITDNRFLKNLTVGGRINWQDKGIVGYYEGAADADGIVRNYDATHPIWDDSHTYVDVFFGYDLRLFSNRVRTHLQLNVRNIQESGRLQAYGANPDGTLTRYRIIDPREYVLQVNFDL
jgi:hypothetical protein